LAEDFAAYTGISCIESAESIRRVWYPASSPLFQV